jgi:hypothetical protein
MSGLWHIRRRLGYQGMVVLIVFDFFLFFLSNNTFGLGTIHNSEILVFYHRDGFTLLFVLAAGWRHSDKVPGL